MSVFRLLRACVLLWLSGPAAAQQDPALPGEEAFLYEPPVVLSASRLDQPLSEAPVTLTVIDRAMIEASGARHIADLFRMVPGFQVARVRGQNHIVGYHGLTGDNGKNMQVLIDGRSVYSLISFGGVDWATLPYSVDDIERIEVVQGSNSAAYGANAFLGVANIITRKPGSLAAVRVSGTAGSDGIRDGNVQLAATGTNLGLRVTAGRRGDDGLDLYADDASLSRFVNARMEWLPSGNDEITVLAGGQIGTRAEGGGTLLDPAHSQSADSAFVQLRWRRTLSPNAEIVLQYYHNRDTIFEHQVFVLPPPFGTLGHDLAVKAHRDHAEFQHIFAAGPRLRVVWGLEGREDRAHSRFYFDDDGRHHATLRRAFGNLEWRVRPDTVANVGATIEDYSLTGTRTAPRFSLSHHLTPEHTLRYAFTQAFLTPTLGESLGRASYRAGGLLFDITLVGNPDLQPARLSAHELGYVADLRKLRTNLNARLFRERIKGLFAERRVSTAPAVELFNPGANMLDNLEDPTIEGLEYQARVDLGALGTLTVSQAYVDIDRPKKVYAGGDRHDESAPRRSLHALLDARLPAGLKLGVAFQRVSGMHWLGRGDEQPAHSWLDIRLAGELRHARGNVQLALVARNALDQRYSEFRSANVVEPRYYATLSATF